MQSLEKAGSGGREESPDAGSVHILNTDSYYRSNISFSGKDREMANKYSKSNNSSKASEQKTMQYYEERRKKLNKSANIEKTKYPKALL